MPGKIFPMSNQGKAPLPTSNRAGLIFSREACSIPISLVSQSGHRGLRSLMARRPLEGRRYMNAECESAKKCFPRGNVSWQPANATASRLTPISAAMARSGYLPSIDAITLGTNGVSADDTKPRSAS
jgi:hypothetical protein